ncbi:MAG: MFS transporter [Acidimicrobiia bacterium]|nr:MFS transporter [Acidimicrobiia bacterium]
MSNQRSGFRTFLIVWIGQLISVTGSTLTGFGLAIWVYVETDSVTLLAVLTLAASVPGMAITPFAGPLVDRMDRRIVMLLADSAAGLATMAAAALYFTGNLEVWHIYPIAAVGSMANAFQEPAYLASVPLMVPKEHIGRANGMIQLGPAIGTITAPALAGVLVLTAGIGAVLLVDMATFIVAVGTLSLVRIPRPERTSDEDEGEPLLRGFGRGWSYIRERPGLFGFLLMAALLNFILGFANVLFLPLLLSFSNEAAAGGIMSIAGIGMLVGSVVMSVWGGPKRRVPGMLGFMAISGVAVSITGVRASVLWIAGSAFTLMATVAIVNGTSQALWHTKVAPDMQGRVFSVRRLLAQFAAPISYLLAGPLADNVFEPALAEGGALADSVGAIIGTGPGRGIGFLFVLMGIGTVLVAFAAYGRPHIRNLEFELPDMIGGTVGKARQFGA